MGGVESNWARSFPGRSPRTIAEDGTSVPVTGITCDKYFVFAKILVIYSCETLMADDKHFYGFKHKLVFGRPEWEILLRFFGGEQG